LSSGSGTNYRGSLSLISEVDADADVRQSEPDGGDAAIAIGS